MTSSRSNEFIAEVVRAIRDCCSDQVDNKVVNRLVRFAAQVAKQRLWGRIHAAARARDISAEQAAISMVSILFVGESKNIKLRYALQNDLESDDINLFLKFKAVVIRTVAQELFHRWSETDPQSAKLWRNLNRGIRSDSRLTLFPSDKPEWVMLSSSEKDRQELQLVEYEKIMSLISAAADTGSSMTDWIHSLLTHEEFSANAVAIKIEHLFAAIRESIFSGVSQEVTAHTISPEKDSDLNIALDRALSAAQTKLDENMNRYKASGKFDPITCEKLACALQEILKDCADGGPAMSYFEYVREQNPDLRKTTYREEYRTRFEYLAEQVQREFYDALRREYGE